MKMKNGNERSFKLRQTRQDLPRPFTGLILYGMKKIMGVYSFSSSPVIFIGTYLWYIYLFNCYARLSSCGGRQISLIIYTQEGLIHAMH